MSQCNESSLNKNVQDQADDTAGLGGILTLLTYPPALPLLMEGEDRRVCRDRRVADRRVRAREYSADDSTRA